MSGQNSEVMLTGVDRLVALLKQSGHIEISEAAKKLNYPSEIVQSWVDFLVEEKIVGLDYNLTKPSIYLVENETSKDLRLNLANYFKNYKENFYSNLKKHEKNSDKRDAEWKEHLLSKLELVKQFFFAEAEKRKLSETEKLWEEYKKRIISL